MVMTRQSSPVRRLWRPRQGELGAGEPGAGAGELATAGSSSGQGQAWEKEAVWGLEERPDRYLVNRLEDDDGYREEGGEAALDVAVDLGEVAEVEDTDGEELEVEGALGAAGLLGGGARGEGGAREVRLQETRL